MSGDSVADILARLGNLPAAPRKAFAEDLLENLLAELEGDDASQLPPGPRRRIGRWLASVAAALVPFALAFLLLARGFLQSTTVSTGVDPHTAAVVRTIDAGVAPAGVAVANGSVWVGHYHGDQVWRIDPETGRRVEIFHTGTAPISVVAGFGSVWTANSQAGSVSRIDPATQSVVTIRMPEDPAFVAVGTDAVWIASRGDDFVHGIDPRTNMVTRTIDLGVTPGGLAAGAGALWATDSARNQLLRIDPTSGHVARVGVGDDPTGLAVSTGAVWVASSHSNELVRVDPRTLRVEARVPVGAYPVAVEVEGRTIWVVSATDGSLSAVSAQARVVRTIPLGAGVQWIHAVRDAIWVLAYPAGREGVLYELTGQTR